jgi:branched-chain amino acid transport system permease protein
MLTLAFAQLVWAIAFKWRSVTGGDDGFLRVAVPEAITSPAAFYYFTLCVVAVSIGLLWVVVRSPFGRVLIATRENALRATFVGADVRRMHLLAFVISGAFSGVAGALFAMFNRSIFTEQAWWLQSAEVLIMVILGGIHAFLGPALGAAVLIGLERFIHEFTQYWPTVLGLILLAVLFLFPAGLAGLLGVDRRRKQMRGDREEMAAGEPPPDKALSGNV